MITSKPWYASLTLWVNLLSIIAVGLVTAGPLADLLQLTPQQVAAGAVLLAVVNGAIRVLRTNQPISGTPAQAALEHAAVMRRLTED